MGLVAFRSERVTLRVDDAQQGLFPRDDGASRSAMVASTTIAANAARGFGRIVTTFDISAALGVPATTGA